MTEIKRKTDLKEIRDFMESGTDGRKLTLAEVKALSKEDRVELAEMIRSLS